MEDKTTNENEAKTEFKMPILVGKIGKLPKKADFKKDNCEEKNNFKSLQENPDSSKPSSSLPPAVLLKEMSTPIPYKEPKWSGMCPDGSDYALEVLKSGMIVEKIDLSKKSYYVIGRLANSDIVMAHPTISRHHAVLQYKAFAEEGEPPSGWYLYDLGSTHCTYLNRDKLKPNHYTRVRVGHQIKFGNSTRTYIMLGPDFDCEGESELTVTEIKQKALEMKLERDRLIKEAIETRKKEKEEEDKKREEMGIDWGMGEDAEEEPDLAENPYASTANEELYLEDPKKTLRGYFEREGEELQYDCEERGVGQFLCRVQLPLDDPSGRPVMAEVMHRGKKKEAVIACALEACRVLDRAGLLRQAKHESRRRKARDWSADDYYDSDDDSFLDRTGAVEKKRTQRMKKHGAVEVKAASHKPLTYDDLLKQSADLESRISREEKALERLRAIGKKSEEQSSDDVDALDQFMSSLGKQGQSMAQKAEISSAKMNIQKLKTELAKTHKLAEIARPANMPQLIKKDHKKLPVKVGTNSIVYGKRIRLKEDESRPKTDRSKVKREEEREFVEEVDSDEEESNTNDPSKSSPEHTEVKPESSTTESVISKKIEKDTKNDTDESSSRQEDTEVVSEVKHIKEEQVTKRVFGPLRPPDNYVIPESYFDQNSDRDLPEIMEEE